MPDKLGGGRAIRLGFTGRDLVVAALFALLLAVPQTLAAQDDDKSESDDWSFPNVSGSGGIDFVTGYIFRGVDVLDDRAAVQPAVSLTFDDVGVEVGIWASFSTAARETRGLRQLDEFDLTFSWSHSVSIVDFSVGHVSYIYPQFRGHAAYTAEFFTSGTVNLPIPVDDFEVSVSLFMAWDYDQGNDIYINVSGDTSWKALAWDDGSLTLMGGLWFGYNNGQFNVDANISDIDFHLGASVDVYIVTFEMEGHMVLIPEETVNPDDYEFWLRIGASVSF